VKVQVVEDVWFQIGLVIGAGLMVLGMAVLVGRSRQRQRQSAIIMGSNKRVGEALGLGFEDEEDDLLISSQF